ncbi:MAG: isoprenylcysteine carboxylmethyltransferase family protein [Gammaproteobacteria bacterium]|nr:isoprenylcysteine carboxylmethyltransferase family protein [Gammaproteobacteria bacterium]
MASEFMKSLLCKHLRLQGQNYRLLFNTIAVVSSVLIIYLYTLTETLWSNHSNTFISLIGYAFVLIGIMIVVKSISAYGIMSFAGFKAENPKDELVTTGLNTYVRHPLYAGVLIALAGWLIVTQSIAAIVTLVVTWVYVLVGIQLEEQKLILQYGDAYRTYQHKVSKLFPLHKKA